MKKLFISLKKKSGRNNEGSLIFFGRGGGFKRLYRVIDFSRFMYFLPYYIIRFEYDPNRSVFIMLISYLNGFISYKIAPTLVTSGMIILDNFKFLGKNGSFGQLMQCNVGSFIYNYQSSLYGLSKYARSAGVYIQLVRKLGSFGLLRFSSGEERFVSLFSYCCIGRVSGRLVKLMKKVSAGSNIRRGFKSKVRGVAKNPIDHPHGGGEGRTTAGQPSVTPWGIYTKGVRTTTRFKRFVWYRYGFFRRRNKINW